MRTLALLSLFAAACAPTTAVVNGQTVARPTLAYTDGTYYAVTHYRAYPEHRGASSGLHSYGGRLAGFACGAEFWYESDFVGKAIRLSGYAQAVRSPIGHVIVPVPAHIEVRDVDAHRHVYGSIGADMGNLITAVNRPSRVIDFTLGPDGLHGQIGSRWFELGPVDVDTMAGTMKISTGDVLPFELRGVSAMWSMPAADQAAILPFMMTCSQIEDGRHDVGVTTETNAPLQFVDLSHRG